MRKTRTPWEPAHRASLRHRVAVEAARLLYTREFKEYFQAKREAARRQGSLHLPSNREIHQQLLVLARRLDGDEHARRLLQLRRDALALMEHLGDFHPRLIGSVWTGHIRPGSDIDLNVYCDDLDAVQEALSDYQVELEIVRSRKGGEAKEYVHLHLSGGGLSSAAEVTVYPLDERHQRPRCGITGGPMARGSLAELRALLQQPQATEVGSWQVPTGLAGWLEQVPELLDCRDVLQNHYHHLDVFDHTLAVLRGVEELVASGFERLQPWSRRLQEGIDVPLLLLAAVCHDLGKPETQSFARDGRIRFLGHEHRGAAMVGPIAARLGLEPGRTRGLEKLVRWHLEAILVPAENGGPSHIHRLFRELGQHLPELALLSLADIEASRGPARTALGLEAQLEFVQFLLGQYYEQGFLAHPSLPVRVEDLEELFGIRQPATQTAILEWLTEQFVEGEFESQEEGLSLVDEFLADPRHRNLLRREDRISRA